MTLILGLLLSLGGSVAFYLASPHQLCLRQPWPARPARLAALLLIGGSVLPLSQALLPATLLFVLLTWLMLLLSLLPYLGALYQHLAREASHEPG